VVLDLEGRRTRTEVALNPQDAEVATDEILHRLARAVWIENCDASNGEASIRLVHDQHPTRGERPRRVVEETMTGDEDGAGSEDAPETGIVPIDSDVYDTVDWVRHRSRRAGRGHGGSSANEAQRERQAPASERIATR
jgi:hypothetical protein